MKWTDWKSTYGQIVKDFSLDMEREVSAADAAARASRNDNCLKGNDALEELGRRIRRVCIVCGNSRGLEQDVRKLLACGAIDDSTVIAADAAGPRIGRLGMVPDVIVTDMDGEPEAEMEQNRKGSLLLLHFHGDNLERMSGISGRLGGRFVSTVQCQPPEGVFNFGGFTDGDRAVLLAEEFGARCIVLAGFDFGRPFEYGQEGEIKLRKLKWAESIIQGARSRGVTICDVREYALLMETSKKVNA